ncbi:MAG: hypothetical protein ACOCV9_00995 [Marinilabiliaceae bacterium]
MIADEIVKSDIFQKCLDFPGHLCPGLSAGYQSAMAGHGMVVDQKVRK